MVFKYTKEANFDSKTTANATSKKDLVIAVPYRSVVFSNPHKNNSPNEKQTS